MSRINGTPMMIDDPNIPHSGPMSAHVSISVVEGEGVRVTVRGSSIVLPKTMAIELARLILVVAENVNG